ncbi:MAG TPA: response regulator transcription factor [Nitrospiraceae bacterium]|nr:response regulator transcription factor [Nitrospiraceae bacterium]
MSLARKPIRLLLVDDHQVVRVGLRTVLHNRQGITVVGEAGSKAAAVQAVKRLKPDIALIDVRLPDGSGIDASRDILAGHPTTRIIFLTSYVDDDSALAAALAGAYGYVLKDINSGLLIRSIRAVADGQSILDPALTQRALSWSKAGSAQAPPVREQSLAPQEERVLALIAEGLTNKEIAARMQLSDKTVKNYIANMFQKLHISRRAQAAAFFVKSQT